MPFINGGGAAFNGGTITKPLVIAPTSTSARPLVLQLPAGSSNDGDYALLVTSADAAGDHSMQALDVFGSVLGTTDAALGGELRYRDRAGSPTFTYNPYGDGLLSIPAGHAVAIQTSAALGIAQFDAATRQLQAFRFTSALNPPATAALVSATGAQLSTVTDVDSYTPVTFNPGAATTATCAIAVSPDNVTYYTLGVETEPVGVALDGTIHVIRVRVPAAWYLKLTVTNATIGTTTYY